MKAIPTKPVLTKPDPSDVLRAASVAALKRSPLTIAAFGKALWPGRIYVESALLAVLSALSSLGLAPAWFKPQSRTGSGNPASPETCQNRAGKVPPAHAPYGAAMRPSDGGKVAKPALSAEPPPGDRFAIGDVVSRDATGEAKPCGYCRAPAQCVDRFGNSENYREVPACLDCRKHARRSGYTSLTKRRAAVKRGIASDADAYLAMPNWTPSELDKLGPRMRTAVKLAMRRKAIAKRRLG